METLTVELTYAQALFDAARDRGMIYEVAEEYGDVTETFRQNPDLKRLFIIPTLSALEKNTVAKKIFEGRISRELMNFICILIDKRRIGAWDGIGRQYEKLVLEKDGLTRGVVYTAVPLDAARREALEEKAGAAIGKMVKLENHIDKSIIGGAKIYVDGKLIDASVKARLEEMKQRIRT
ncbi:MAG: ATP synthase F1 subunit delta [Clostridiales bacterium]|nr:ATP synthase F1 subunit delta [Clostridiales bacterium]